MISWYPGSKQNIDDETPIELSCDTDHTSIFYTINGEKPVPFDPKDRNTYAYTGNQRNSQIRYVKNISLKIFIKWTDSSS